MCRPISSLLTQKGFCLSFYSAGLDIGYFNSDNEVITTARLTVLNRMQHPFYKKVTIMFYPEEDRPTLSVCFSMKAIFPLKAIGVLYRFCCNQSINKSGVQGRFPRASKHFFLSTIRFLILTI